MKILLFGETGQVGSALMPVLTSMGDLVSIGRDNSSGLWGNLEKPEAVADSVRSASPEVVVNAAAFTAVDRAEVERNLAYTVNAASPSALAAACSEVGALLVHYSTDYVFRGDGSRPWREGDPVDPQNEYGRTKLAGEEGIRRSACKHMIFRTSWVYSVTGHNFLRTMLQLASERDSLSIVDDQWGAPSSASLVARLTGRMIGAAIEGQSVGGTYHLAPSGETTWYRYACRAIERARALGWPVRVDEKDIHPVRSSEFPTVAKRPYNSRLNCEALERVLQQPMPDWRVGVDSAVMEIVELRKGS